MKPWQKMQSTWDDKKKSNPSYCTLLGMASRRARSS